jgi:heterodisulfide reductase subunit C
MASSEKIVYKTPDDFDFYKEIAETGADGIKKCIQCGTCTSTCVVQELDPDFDIRRIIAKIKLGLRSDVLKCDAIWSCARCYLCIARCPKNVKPGDIILALQGIALKDGIDAHGAHHVEAFANSVEKYGKISEARVTIDTIGFGGVLKQGSLAFRMMMKGKSPKYFKKPIKGIDEVRKIKKAVKEGGR